MGEKHLIKQQKIIIKISDEKDAFSLQNRVAQLFHDRLIHIFDQIFSDFFPNEEILKIDRLTIDMGRVSESNLEQTIEAALAQQLPLILAQIIREKGNNTSEKNKRSDLELLHFYLKNGHLPWWVSNEQQFNLDELLQRLFEKDTLATQQLLLRLMSLPQIRKRLLYQLKDDTLQHIKKMISGSTHAQYNWYLKQLSKLHQHAKIREITKKSYSFFTENLLLDYLSQKTQLVQSPQNFSLYFLEEVIQEFNISPEEIQKYYQVRVPEKSASQAELKWLNSIDTWIEERNTKSETVLSKTELVFKFLKTGLIPANTNGVITTADIEARIIELSENGNPVWIERLKELLKSPTVLERMRWQLQSTTLESMHRMLYGKKHFRLIKYIWREVRKIRQLSSFTTVEDENLYSIYLDAVTRYFLNFKELEDFGIKFLNFLSIHLEKTENINLNEYRETLSATDREIVIKSSVLRRVFQINRISEAFVGNLFEPNFFQKKSLIELFDFQALLAVNNEYTEVHISDKSMISETQEKMKTHLLQTIRSTDFYAKTAPALNIVEIANIGQIIFVKETPKYVKTVELLSQFLIQKPLPKEVNKSQMQPARLLWLSLLKSASQKNYHGNRGQKFWQNWMTALSELLQISVEKLWLHFQGIPREISQAFPDFSAKIDKSDPHFFSNTDEEQIEITEPTDIDLIRIFLQENKVPANQTLTQFDNFIKQLIRTNSSELEMVVLSALADFKFLKNFHRLSPQTVEIIQQHYFTGHRNFLEQSFRDFQKVVKRSAILPSLSTVTLERDVRIGLLYAVKKTGMKAPITEDLVEVIFRVLEIFYPVSKAMLKLDFAKSVQKNRLKLESHLGSYFKSIKLPVKNYNQIQSLLYFLQNGALVAEGKFNNLTEMQDWLADNEIAFSEYFKTALLHALQDEKQLQRLFQQFTLRAVQAVSKILAGKHFSVLAQTIKEFEKFFKKQDYPSAVKLKSEEIMQTGLLQFLVKNPEPPYLPGELFQSLLQHISVRFEIEVSSVKSQGDLKKIFGSETTTLTEKTENVLSREQLEIAFFTFIRTQALPLEVAKTFSSAETLLLEISKQASTSFMQKLRSIIQRNAKKSLPLVKQTFSLIGIKILNRLVNVGWIQKEEKTLEDIYLLFKNVGIVSLEDHRLELIIESAVLELLVNKPATKISLLLDIIFQKITSIISLSTVELYEELVEITKKHQGSFAKNNEISTWISKNSNPFSVKKEKENRRKKKEKRLLEPQILSEHLADLEGVIEFLKSGIFSRDNPLNSIKKAEKVLLNLLKIEPRKVHAEFEKSFLIAKVAERLEDNFTVSILDKMIQVFGKIIGEDLTEILQLWEVIKWIDLAQSVKPLSANSTRVIAIDVLLSSKGAETKPVSFLKKIFQIQAVKAQMPVSTLMRLVSTHLLAKNRKTEERQLVEKIQEWAKRGAIKEVESALEEILTQEQVISKKEEIIETDILFHTQHRTHWETEQEQLLEDLQNIRLFLEHGKVNNKDVFVNKSEFLKVFQKRLNKYPHLIKKVLQHLMENQEAIFRILSVFSQKNILKIIRLLYGGKAEVILQYWKDLLLLLPGVLSRFNLREAKDFFGYQVLSYYSRGRFEMALIEQFFAHLISTLAKKDGKNSLAVLYRIEENSQKEQSRMKGNWGKMTPKLYQLLKDDIEKGQQKLKWDLENKNENMEDKYFFINNAGLVIIAPFFPRYFETLGMMKEGQFINEAAAQRAVHLLQYIATGQTNTEEPFLLFNKMLCGLPVMTPVARSIELTEQERTTTNDMMQAILTYWKGLGTTTLEGLRGGFILREGRLEWNDGEYWNLSIEKKAYDILLQSLPWSISIIQPPWIKYRIQVIWN